MSLSSLMRQLIGLVVSLYIQAGGYPLDLFFCAQIFVCLLSAPSDGPGSVWQVKYNIEVP